MKKIVSVFVSLSIALSLAFSSFPAAAAGEDYSSTIVGWWDQLLYGIVNGSGNNSIIQTGAGWISSGSVCPSSDDGHHHASSLPKGTMGYDADGGYYTYARCTACGDQFKYYSSDLKAQQTSAGAGRDFDSVSSEGSFIVQMKHDYLEYYASQRNGLYYCSHKSGSNLSYLPSSSVSLSNDHLSFIGFPPSGSSSFGFYRAHFHFTFNVSVDGFYSYLPDLKISSFSAISSSDNVSSLPLVDESWFSDTSVRYSEGSIISREGVFYPSTFINSSDYYFKHLSFSVNAPRLKVVPLSGLVNIHTDPNYGDNTRAGASSGYYGSTTSSLTDNSVKIVDESSNTIYNPVTGDTTNITSWNYDYSDRSYNVVTESGDTVTVTYGDTNVTIKEGDTIYNIYYIFPSSGVGGEDTHVHSWELTEEKYTYCTLPGEAIYTCSTCGETKTESLKVLGHTWKVLREVHTQYDDSGELTQEGYILYECERCGEQYKAESGGVPPGTNEPSGPGSSGPVVSSGSRVFQNSLPSITQNYGNDGHTGTDVVPNTGGSDFVVAHSEGEVVWVQTGQSNNQGSSGDLSYGNSVKIKHSNGYYTLYAHLASCMVSKGDHVYRGQVLGLMGNTGNSYGAHLHFEVRDSSDSQINSDPYINADLPNFEGGGSSSGSGSSGGGSGGWLSSLGNLIGSIFGGIGEIFNAAIAKILDVLSGLVEIVTGKLADVVSSILSIFEVIPQMFGGFMDFLGSAFSFIPAEIVTLLTFGVAAVVLIGILKAVRR